MSEPTRIYPVSRRRVLASGFLFLAALAGVAGLADALRHPAAPDPAAERYEPADPRDEVACPSTPRPGSAVRVSSTTLYECPHTFDGRTVRYEGEVVGAVLTRSDGAWLQLNDDDYAGDLGPLPAHGQFRGGNSGIGVHVARHLAEDITFVGGPRARGDVLTVTGTFHLSDSASGEVAVIRAEAGEIVSHGGPISRPPLRDRQVAGVILGLLAAASLARPLLTAGRR